MLDKTKLLKEIQKHSSKIFYDISNELLILKKTWESILSDSEFIKKVEEKSFNFLVPSLKNSDLSKKIKIDSDIESYHVIGVDGSQIYPDRHRGTLCFLINTGLVSLSYGLKSKAKFFNKPEVFVLDDISDEFNFSDYVDALREDFEFGEGFNLANLQEDKSKLLLCFDGSLMFWNLVSKTKKFQEKFLAKYLSSFEKMFNQEMNFCSYISLPKNKEMVNLVKLKLSDFDLNQKELYSVIDGLDDTHIMQDFLPPFYRTDLFKNNSELSMYYPDNLRISFFYINVGYEIARVEIPNFIAQDPLRVDFISKIIVDQVKKGMGYPAVLAESHEQAVVKNSDKEFFYTLIDQIGVKKKNTFQKSQKSLKKLKMSI